jgi:hypothetical protein
MTIRRAKNIVLLSGAIAIYGAAIGAYLLEKDIHLADYIKIPAINFIETASADTFTNEDNVVFKDLKFFAAQDDEESVKEQPLWRHLPDMETVKTYITFEWPELPEISIPELTLP